MFNFLKNKSINTEKVKGFNKAISIINTFIFIEEWENSYNAIKEVKNKEKIAYKELMEKITDSNKIDLKEKEKQTGIYNKKIKELNTLEVITHKKEDNFNKKNESKRFKVRFEQIKGEIKRLSKTHKSNEALNLLTNFLEENKDKEQVIIFFNKEKKFILKGIEQQRKIDESKIKNNAKLEAIKLMGETLNIEEKNTEIKNEKKGKKNINFFIKIIQKINFYRHIKEKLKRKHMIDEISLLIDENSKTKKDIASKKLANIHKGLIKEISNENLLGYDLYGKILGADKISGDTFGLNENNKKYVFFIGDATGHGIRAGFIVTLLTKIFNDFAHKSNLKKLCFEINNGLKQNLKNRNFITGIFFEIIKKDIGKIKFVGMGHEPLLIFRNKTQKVEKIIPGGLAAGIRIFKDEKDIKINELILEDNDVLITYSDGIVESKNKNGELYGIDNLKNILGKICTTERDIGKIYEHIMTNLSLFKGGTNFNDDTTLFLIKRNTKKDIQDEGNEYLKELTLSEGLNKKQTKILVGKTKNEIEIEIEKIKKQKELKNIIKSLDNLYYTGEVLKLKQEAIRFIKKGYIDKNINKYLRIAIANETKYKINKKNQKIISKYNVLLELYKKGDLNTVIQEAENIIAKDGNI